MKKWYIECPYCANEIKEGATKCQYCKEFIWWKESENKEILKNKPDSWHKKLKIILWAVLWGATIIALGIIFGLKLLKPDTW